MTPTTEAELADMIAGAAGPLRVVGGGTRPIGNPVVGEVLETSGLSGITLYEPGALTLVAQAGTPVAQIEAALEVENQRLAFEPMDHRTLMGTHGVPTIGGVVAGNVSGPRRIAVGACRDHALGVRFVDGAGTAIKNGGRVMKNVTGYDLVKLLCGSHGTLGVLSDVSLKVLPKPETSATLVVHGLDAAQSVAAMSAVLGSPYEVTGAAHGTDTVIRIEGFEASVAYRAGKLRDLLGAFGEVSDGDAAIWTGVRDVADFADMAAVWRVSVKPSDAPAVLDNLRQTVAFEVRMDWGGGLIWLGLTDDMARDIAKQDADDLGGMKACHMSIQTHVGLTGGHATLIKGAEALRAAVPVFQPENDVVTALSSGLRARFDPRGILNAGLMG